jgi:uncharacterized membrane protein YgdD (TMEM256/DUF423 family)
MPKPTYLTLFTASNGFCAVLLGALGAHALEATLSARGSLGAWQTATQYQLAHVVGSLALLAWAAAEPAGARPARLRRIAWLWQSGCILFSGSIYILALGGPRFLGPVTPLGGLAFLAGWALLAVEAFRSSPTRPPSTSA